MSDETFAEATMRKMREMEAENRRLRKENKGLREAVDRIRTKQEEASTWDDLMEQYRRNGNPYRRLCWSA